MNVYWEFHIEIAGMLAIDTTTTTTVVKSYIRLNK